jgi:predicted amino acid dehydrogenase
MLRIVQMVCDGVLAVHWTKQRGIGLSDFQIGVLGLTGGIATAYLRWKSM